jgi:integrase
MYRHHKASGQAIVTLPFGDGSRRDYLLGPYGSDESHSEYSRLITEWRANNRRRPDPLTTNDTTITELCWGFFAHVETYYQRPDRTPTGEVGEYKLALRSLRELYGDSLCRDFGPLQLKAVRQRMIDAGLARGVINQRIWRIKMAFQWGVENDLVPIMVNEHGKSNYHAMLAVRNLQPGRSKAKETSAVRPVDLEIVQATLPYLTRQVAAMIQVQLLAGARPGEVCIMRGCDIDSTGPVWLYYPGRDQGPHGQHKTAHHGYSKVIAIGPKAQEILTRFLKDDPQAYLFSPREARAEWEAERRCNRETPMTPSQRARKRKSKPAWSPGDRYLVSSYATAIRRGCLLAGTLVRVTADANNVALKIEGRTRAATGSRRKVFTYEGRLLRVNEDGFAIADKQGKRELVFTVSCGAVVTCDGQTCRLRNLKTAIPSWHPHQLRHTRGTEIRRRYGAEAAQVVLGHATLDATEVYAETNLGIAETIMQEIG